MAATGSDSGVMADRPATSGPGGAVRRRGLRGRVIVVFVTVALVSIGVLATVVLIGARGDLASADATRQQQTADQAAALVGDAARGDGSFEPSGLMSAAAVAAAEGGRLRVFGPQGQLLDIDGAMRGPAGSGPMSDNGPGRMPGAMGEGRGEDGAGTMQPPAAGEHERMMELMFGGEVVEGEGRAVEAAALDAQGDEVGVVEVVFATEAGVSSELAAALGRTVGVAALTVALLAVVAAIIAANRLTLPLGALTAAVAKMAAGDRAVRSQRHDAPGEIGELSRSVDQLADTLSENERLRRAVVADLAHELRTPLAIALAEADAMVDGINERSDEQLRSVRDELASLATLVGDLEALAAAEAAVLQLEPEALDLAELVSDRVERARPSLEADSRELRVRLQPTPIEADPARLAQVVDNLLSNAAKFTPPHGTIDVDVRPDGNAAQLRVADNGPGIPLEDRPHVLERFFRAPNTRHVAGSGIGLAVVAQIVRAHHGEITIDDGLDDRGTTVRVQLPGASGPTQRRSS